MTPNINPDTGIAYGYISSNALDSETVDHLIYGNPKATNLTYRAALADWLADERQMHTSAAVPGDTQFDDDGQFDEGRASDYFNDGVYFADEEVTEGEIEIPQHGNFPVGWVRYQSSWLGGALNFWIFDSPCVTQSARRASPCVPNAGILDTLDGDVTAYDVPADWRHQE